MKLFRTTGGVFVEQGGQHFLIADHSWDALLGYDNLPEFLAGFVERASPLARFHEGELLAPISGQEVWAAGVTYYRSRGARMEESKDAGGGSFYDRVYSAERPELWGFWCVPWSCPGSHWHQVRVIVPWVWRSPQLERR